MGRKPPVDTTPEPGDHLLSGEEQARRDFLQKVGKFALVTPPAVTTLLATSMNSRALALSGGRGPQPDVVTGPQPGVVTPPLTPKPEVPPQQPKPPGVSKPPKRSVFDDLIAKCINLFS